MRMPIQKSTIVKAAGVYLATQFVAVAQGVQDIATAHERSNAHGSTLAAEYDDVTRGTDIIRIMGAPTHYAIGFVVNHR